LRLRETIPYDSVRHVYRNLHGLAIPASDAADLHYLECSGCGLRFFDPMVTGDALFYEQLQSFPWYYLAEKEEYDIAKRFISERSSVLEIGCGSGKFAARLPSACTYRGLEFNDEAVRKAQASGLRVDRMSIEEFARQEPGAFDVVCCFQVLEHVASPASLISAAIRLLTPAGLLIISVPSEDSFMFDELNNVFNVPPHHVTRWTDAAMESIARLNELQLVRLEHEELSAMHLRPYAKARLLRSLRRAGFKVPMISRFAATYPVRAAMAVASKPIEWATRAAKRSVRGHSVVAVYAKSQ